MGIGTGRGAGQRREDSSSPVLVRFGQPVSSALRADSFCVQSREMRLPLQILSPLHFASSTLPFGMIKDPSSMVI